MKILTLWQPWASLIALGLKEYETRSWGTSYRGELAIHAAKRKMDMDAKLTWSNAISLAQEAGKDVSRLPYLEDIPLGEIVAVVNLTDCLRMVDNPSLKSRSTILIEDQSYLELEVGFWTLEEGDRYAWKLENIRPLHSPIPYKGSQGLKDIDPDYLQLIEQN